MSPAQVAPEAVLPSAAESLPPSLAGLVAGPGRADRLTHVARVSARPGLALDWPGWVPAELTAALARRGVQRPWAHQVAAADAAWAGRSVVLSTGTASGKSLGYLLPGLAHVLAGREHVSGRGATVLYLSPTKALAADQLRTLTDLGLPGVRAATYDGDTPAEERAWVRDHAAYVLTNPDLLHHSLLPGHQRWSGFLRSLEVVVVDECHRYRGVFGSHVAAVLRRLRRICARYGSDPVFVLCSATVSEPAAMAGRLTGLDVEAVDGDASPRGEAVIALWEPPLLPGRGERGAPVRRPATAETADLLTDLVVEGVRTVAFVRSRRGAESVAASTRRLLGEVDPALAGQVAAYRGGYLPEERRELEQRLQDGSLRAVAATTALELGIDVSGLDAVLMAGYPGTRASFWQQAGRAGRAGQGSLAVLVCRDDPLDTYLAHHPEALLGRPVEASVLDPDNPYVLGPHLAAAAAELPVTEADVELFGPRTPEVLAGLVADGLLRRRATGWYWVRPERASDLTDIRGSGERPVRVVEAATGRLLGTVEQGAHATAHAGAVYLHQGVTWLVRSLDLVERVALAEPAEVDYSTFARDVSDIRVVDQTQGLEWGDTRLALGTVDVTSQVVSFLRKRVVTGEVLGEEALDLPRRTLRTRAVWWTVTPRQLDRAGLEWSEVPGAAHAAEHAAIGLLPLFATCDRWDIGGVSTALHPDTGLTTVFVHDGHPGGAGFAERGFAAAEPWLRATLEAVSSCECEQGCPSCVQSPKCGNGNDPLSKVGAVALLRTVLQDAPR